MKAQTFEKRLVELIEGSERLMQALEAGRELGLAAWCIGAGAVRNLVWDHLHGFEEPASDGDVDLVYFDPVDVRSDLERSLERSLVELMPTLRWEVVNQASVHLWLQTRSDVDQRLQPFESLEQGVASWPETATCVGATLDVLGNISVIAPHGLADLFDMTVRWNSACLSRRAYRERLVQKRWEVRWPRIKVLDLVDWVDTAKGAQNDLNALR